MSIIQNYKSGQFSQINLDDGNKILVSYGATDIRLLKLGFLSIPKETIHIFNNQFTYDLTQKIGYDLSKEIVKILSDELVKARSISELKEICEKIEKSKSFLEKI
jgi:hypothetical protein